MDPGAGLHVLPLIRAMYITDLRHFLDAAGAIGPIKGPARAMAQFHADVVAHASNAQRTGANCAEVLQVQEERCRRPTRRRRCHCLGLPEMSHRGPHLELARHAVGPARPAAPTQLTEA